MRLTKILPIGLGVCALLTAGCSQRTISSANQDAQHDVTVLSKAANQAATAVKPQLKKAALGARVETALVAANLHDIRVDAAPNGVTLVGHVKTQSQAQRAVQIAQDTLGHGKTVQSRLHVGG